MIHTQKHNRDGDKQAKVMDYSFNTFIMVKGVVQYKIKIVKMYL